ncbi:DEAD/DEAH box helicase [Roseateles toxinivorans]|uniref:Superfamily II DNA/RNA helicase n=1 Tax=Roseateles toxinivorans TaxID=270368 RepID=A0A4R6QGC1_9BURK|nr:DEAD/DEAH box helicase [Roseateles toxinivorans]TDP61584.1 superfamily II DNA/RNA helicase [Roseateles toxinivorans]
MSFASLGLTSALLRAVGEHGYQEPTPVQTEAIPPALRGADVLASAQTGTGKTAAFGLPLLQRFVQQGRLEGARRTQALILVPTRELALQVGEFLTDVGRFLLNRPKVAVVFGGVSINPQMMALRGGADVVVATPGRLLDLVDHNALSLGAVSLLVLDEADKLLNLGFADEWARIQALLPARRQNLFFSATFPPEVQALAQTLLLDPVRIDIAPEPVAEIVQRAIEVDVPRRTQLLRHLIESQNWTQVLVFVATKYASGLVADKLGRAGIQAASLHGDLSQGGRVDALEDFKAGQVRVLVATDVAARGLDISKLPVVVNYDLPRAAADYTHRIGRTGRAGQAGLAVSFISAGTEGHFRLIEKRQQQRVPREQIAGFEPVEVATPDQAVGGVKGARKSKKDKLREAAAAAPARKS